MKSEVAIFLVAFLTFNVFGSPMARATKPCPAAPCADATGSFDRHVCEKKADWIAEGMITKVRHHREGAPLNKDFAEFTFVVQRWEKKHQGTASKFRFKVGWCENGQELPSATTGLFRVFGLAPVPGSSTEPRYLYIEHVAHEGAD